MELWLLLSIGVARTGVVGWLMLIAASLEKLVVVATLFAKQLEDETDRWIQLIVFLLLAPC